MRWYIYAGIAALLVVCTTAVFLVFHQRSAPEPIAIAAPEPPKWPENSLIGRSVQGRDIQEYTYGDGSKHIVFVGGMHGGYEWNSVLLAYRLMDHLKGGKDTVPANLKITVIPDLNPDGTYEIIGKEGRFSESDVPEGDHASGRFNANGVDLNRNFDCHWKPEGTWKGKTVSAGSAPFSEPEARALREFVLMEKPDAVVFWHSKASAVYASECDDGILPVTRAIMDAYAGATGYDAVESFDAYPVQGDSEGWLASVGIPAITVELSTHESIEWEKNLSGVKALLEYFSAR